ncbi:MAG: (2Fe-2S)-binding protein [Acetobacteraceae bacterium]
MFRRTTDSAAPALSLIVDGTAIQARSGESVAAALLAAGRTVFRHSAISGAPRGPWCLMGACFECLVSIDGVRQRACMIGARAGMVIETGQALSSLKP